MRRRHDACTELKLFAHSAPGVRNASVRFDPATFRPTYQLDVGAPGQSLAFPLAQALGIDPAIVARAQALLDSRERDYESALAELSLRAADMQSEREALTIERASSARERESARELRELSALLRDPARTRFVPVARAAELPRAETARLLRALRRMGIPPGPLLVNARTVPGCARCGRAAVVDSGRIVGAGDAVRGQTCGSHFRHSAACRRHEEGVRGSA